MMQKKMYLMPQALQRGVPSSESRQSGVRLVLQEAQIFTEKINNTAITWTIGGRTSMWNRNMWLITSCNKEAKLTQKYAHHQAPLIQVLWPSFLRMRWTMLVLDISNLDSLTIQRPLFRSACGSWAGYPSWAKYYAFKHCVLRMRWNLFDITNLANNVHIKGRNSWTSIAS